MAREIDEARDEHDDDDHTGADSETEGGENATSTPDDKPAVRARSRSRVVVGPPSPFGAVPERATHWGIVRLGVGGSEDKLTFRSPDGAQELREWPLSELSEATVLQRWGAGTYRVTWWGAAARGGIGFITRGRVVTFHAPEAPPAAVAMPTSAPNGFDQAIAFMRLADERVGTQLSAIAQLATAIAGRQSGGIDAATLQLLMDRQASTMREALQSVTQELRGELAEVRRELASFEEEGEGESTAAAVARAAAPLVKPGKPIGDSVKAAAANWFLEDPGRAVDQIVTLAKVVPGALEALSKASAAAAQQQAPQRPRATVTPIRAVPEPPPPPPVPGLNALSAEAAAAAASAPPAPAE